ncbi:MAG: hypothetical protein KGI52_03810 [Burkholderiales bacterium]|nr:hypothetical protein [Burkholderiales bacterium]
MKLIDEWHQAWKFLSVQANVLGGAMASAYATFYPQLKETISPSMMGYITGAVFALGIIGRVISQQPKPADESNSEVTR